MQYIDKSALVAEIERRATFFMGESKKKTTSDDSSCAVALYGLLSFLDTLEVKEVELDWEINLWVKNLHRVPNFEELNKFAKHFFELGLKA
jgi:hypothetical protein